MALIVLLAGILSIQCAEIQYKYIHLYASCGVDTQLPVCYR
jgi:hypothetical protein